MTEEVKRFRIYKYVKSAKITAITSNSMSNGRTLIDLSSDMRSIDKIRTVKYLKRASVQPTHYFLEATEDIQRISGNEYSMSYRLLRILTNEDVDEGRWKATKSLSELPVSPHPHISKEEKIWAGEREGNISSGISLIIWLCFSWWFLYISIKNDSPLLLPILTSAASSYFLIMFKWRTPKKAITEKINEISNYKERLRTDASIKQEQARTNIEDLLENYSNWEKLSPKEFEHALKYTLEKDGYKLHITKYVGDGGVDLEGTNVEGLPAIVQAKKYSSNVGVAVVREMIGVRESNPSKPETMIVSLVGFTKGAIKLAEQEEIILKSIKKDILKI